MPTLLRRASSPLLSVGNLVFDCEVSVTRGGQREVSERRIAAGATIGDHSRRMPRVFQIEGAVSALAQPQNFGRPGSDIGAEIEALVNGAAGAIVPLDRLVRMQDFESRLNALQDDEVFGVLELVDQVVGRVSVILTEWTATNDPSTGLAGFYRLTLREVQTAGLTIALATPESLALNGSGGALTPGGGGGSQSTPMLLEVTP